MKPAPDPSNPSTLSEEILAYLEAHPEAGDSLQGIVEWWMLERNIMRKTAEVKKALEQLVREGRVEEVQSASNIHYRRKRK